MACGGPMGTLVVMTCRGALDALTKTMDELSQQLISTSRSKRALAKGKVALKKDFWASHEKCLQRVVWILGLAQQQWNISLAKRQPDLVIARLQMSQNTRNAGRVADKTQACGETRDGPQESLHSKYLANADASFNYWQQILLRKESMVSASFGTIGVHSTGSGACDTNQNTSNGASSKCFLYVKPPNWLSQKAWSIITSISHAGFNVNLRVYSVVPWDSPVMRCAENADITGLLELFDNKKRRPLTLQHPAAD